MVDGLPDTPQPGCGEKEGSEGAKSDQTQTLTWASHAFVPGNGGVWTHKRFSSIKVDR